MNPKAGENSSGALRLEGQRGKARSRSRSCGVPEGLKPRSSRWLTRAAPVLGGGPGTPYLCALGCSGPGWRRGRRVRERRGAGRAPGEAAAAGVGGCAGSARGSRDSAAGSEAVAGEAAERRAFKGALTFLGIPLANGRRPGRGRGGASLGSSLRPPLPGA